MALGGYFMNKVVEKPRKLAAVSRCYRAETSNLKHEKGIFRVHQFTKVEMFGVLPSGEVEASNALLEEFLAIQDRLFGDLNLGYSILDMPAHELGNPAYRKYDIEAEFPARGTRGEISSCSNCTDYQSRRLNIRGPTGEFCHTVNGTACAVPRMIMALVEQGQDQDKRIFVPEVLRQYMGGLKELIPPNKKNTLMFAFRLSPHYFWTRRTKQKKKSSTAASASKSN